MLLNIPGSDSEYNTVEVLRDEATQIVGNDKKWTKSKISKMTKDDIVALKPYDVTLLAAVQSCEK